MKKEEIIEMLKSGSIVFKKECMKFRNNKLVRGSFYEYYVDDIKIRESQFYDLPLNAVSKVSGVTSYAYGGIKP